IERNLGKKMRRQETPGFAWDPKETVVKKKGKRFSRPRPRGKKPVSGGRGRNQSSGVFSLTTSRSRTARP
ncbi:MAG: ATP-dependent helicase, partial [Desulfobacula sp.]|nr:ATP-dependent helicase [Desulfobacula sp.]